MFGRDKLLKLYFKEEITIKNNFKPGVKASGKFGLVHVYTGDGKGKTTTAMGLALRALGSGNTVHIIQFMKAESELSGELETISRLDGASFARFGGNLLRKSHAPLDEIKAAMRKGLDEARAVIAGRKYDMVILDEINVAMSGGLADMDDVLGIIEIAGENSVELVLTGRNAPAEIVEAADYVTSMQPVKHPYETSRVAARRGIEY